MDWGGVKEGGGVAPRGPARVLGWTMEVWFGGLDGRVEEAEAEEGWSGVEESVGATEAG